MTNLFKSICIGVAIGWGASSCSSDVDLSGFLPNDNEVNFTAVTSRASGNRWDAGDHIGVFMKAAGTSLDGSALAGPTANVDYVTTKGDGYFAAAGAKLEYPHDGSGVDFIAYYPFAATTTGGVVRVDVSDQANAAAIDLLYADNAKGLTKESGTAALSFSHQLATLSLTLNSADGRTLDGMKVAVGGQPATADFRLSDGTFANAGTATDIPMNVSGSGTTLSATALLLPSVATATAGGALTVKLTGADGKAQTVRLADGVKLEKGHNYTYTLSVKNAGSSAVTPTAPYPHWTETPTITAAQLSAANIKYVTHSFTDGGRKVRNFAALYNTDLKMAYWVAYPLCNYYTHGSGKRRDKWNYDPDISQDLQPNLNGAIGSGYDRGHQMPSADRYTTQEANDQTFYFTNMTPQLSRLNQDGWVTLEDKVRSWSSNIDTLYVVTGASATSSATATDVKYVTTSTGSRMAVPRFYYKALLKIDRQSGTAYTIAFKYDQVATPKGEDPMKHAISVAELERLTGFTFFPTVSATAKASFDKTKWQ